MQQLNFH